MSDRGLAPYLELLEAFLGARTPTTEFERRYLELFKSDNEIRPDKVFEILDGLFADVDAFSMEFGDEDDNLTETQLRERAAKAYRELQKYVDPPSVEL
jgi:hypothetical protein